MNNKWIDSNEQKPDDGVWVLGWNGNELYFDVVVYDSRDGKWTPSDNELGAIEIHSWRELPNPPGLPEIGQDARIADLEAFAQKFLDNFTDCKACDGTGWDNDLDTECIVCKGSKNRIASQGVLYVELPDEARALLAKGK